MSAYQHWNDIGRPTTPAQPIADLVAKLKAAYPAHASAFSWQANNEHYQAEPPLDHTPYSVDGWPLPDPQWVVFATDVMAYAVGGTAEMQRLFDYWLGEAKAGRAAWIKYMIWQGKGYDVRNGWKPTPEDGHTEHVHISARTDYEHFSLGAWSVAPTSSPAAVLHRAWPTWYMPLGTQHHLGDYKGNDFSHGGANPNTTINQGEQADIRAVQSRLKALGFDPGPIDGVFGPKTISAVSAWQHKYHAAATTMPGTVWPDDWGWLFTY